MSRPESPPDKLSEEQLSLIRGELTKRGVRLPCPRCANNEFTLEDQLILQPVQPTILGFQLGGNTIPSVITSCSRCGWVALHALGGLGLLHHEAFHPRPAGDP